jgi:hypothetical protein
MDESYIDALRAKKILKYRIRRVFFQIISIIAILSASYFGWASRSLVASSLSIVKQQISSLRQ